MIEGGFKKILDSNTPVNDVTQGRTLWQQGDQDERRARIVLTLISRDDDHTFDGPSGYATGTVEVACLAPTYTAAKQLAQLARAALDNFTGVSDGTTFGYIEVTNEKDVPAAPLVGQAKATFGVSLSADFLVTAGF